MKKTLTVEVALSEAWYIGNDKMCCNACSDYNCIQITNIIKNKGLPQ